MTNTDLVLGTETLPRKNDITEKEMNFKARCGTHLTVTVDISCLCCGTSETKRVLSSKISVKLSLHVAGQTVK